MLTHFERRGKPVPENAGTLLLRNIDHYWFHTGEAHAIRQMLGHAEPARFRRQHLGGGISTGVEDLSVESIYNHLAELIDAGETVAVATIIDVKGSVPREVGAKMIIHPLGRHVGTVGGGCGEADVMRAALDVIQTGEPATVRVDLTEDVSMQALGVCGGILDVFVERVGSETKDEGRRTKDEDSFVVGQFVLRRRPRSPRSTRANRWRWRPSSAARPRGARRWSGSTSRRWAIWAWATSHRRSSPTRKRSCAAANTNYSSTRSHPRFDASTLHAPRLRRSPAPLARAADRRRRAHRRPAGADGEPVRFRGDGAR